MSTRGRSTRDRVPRAPGSRAAGLALGALADRLLGDPARGHPVAGFGALASLLERTTYADARTRGALHAAVLVGVPTGAAALVDHALRDRPATRTAATALITWAALGGTSLLHEGRAVHAHLAANDLPAARRQVGRIVGRTTDLLDPEGVARAAVESVAENTSDATVATLLLGALAGPPGVVAHRCTNTLDAMVGHRDARYARFGTASARLDDLLAWPGARLTAVLATALAPTVGGSPAEALRAWRRDAPAHPSPNAGRVEAAFAGALGVRLGGATTYGSRTELRPVLGDGRAPATHDVARAAALSSRVQGAAALLAVVAASARERRGRRTGVGAG